MKKIFLAALAALSVAACTEVPVGYEGVSVTQGTLNGVEKSGLVWHGPMTDIHLMSLQQQKWSEKTETYTKDVQQTEVAFTLTYRLDPNAVKTVYTSVGDEWSSKLVPQVVLQSIKDVTGQSEAVKDMINNRAAVQARILAELRPKLAARHVIVEGFEINDVSFSAAFEEAVEAKQIAVENANAAKNKTVEIEEQARQKIITAEAEAKAMKTKTDALAGSPKLVEYEAVQKWDGVLPQYSMGGATPFIQLPSGKR